MTKFEDEWQLLLAARPWFRSRGYDLVDSKEPHGMGLALDSYVGPLVSVEIEADRSQWFVEARPAAAHGDPDGRWDLEVWSIAFGEPVLFHDDRPRSSDPADWWIPIANSWHLSPQLDYLRDHLAEIEAACAPDVVTETLRSLEVARRSELGRF